MTLSNQIFILISIVGAVQCLFLVFYIYSIRKPLDKPTTVLCILLLVYAFRMTKWIAYFLPPPFFNHYNNLCFGLQTVIGPLVYIYLYVLIDKNTEIRKTDFLHFIPFIIVLALSGQLDESAWHIGNIPITANSFYWVLHLIFSWFYLYNYRQYFKELEQNEQNWLLTFLIGNSLMGLSFFVYAFLDIADANIFSVTFTLSSLVLSFVYLKHMNGNIKKQKKVKSGLDETMIGIYKNKLETLILQKVYTDTNLTLPKLAQKMNIQAYLLSQIINENYSQSFSDFINSHRIEEAQKLLKSPLYQDQKIASIAYDCGFNTLSAFNTAFKKFTNTTPSQFRNSL